MLKKHNLNSPFEIKDEKDLKEKLNLNFIDLINKSHCVGKFDFPALLTPLNVDIDYLALYSDKFQYCKTSNTCVCFYEYDLVFDGINGLFNAIYYKNEELIKKFKERFKYVKYFISPDYSLVGDCPEAFNIFSIFKSRLVSLALTLLFDKIVIPNITYSTEKSFTYMLDGLEKCSIIAFSTKGSLKNKAQKELLIKAINYTVDHLQNLKKIIVYDVSLDKEKIYHLFNYAIANNISIIIPNNILRERNFSITRC